MTTCCRCFASFSLLTFTLKTVTPTAFRKANFRTSTPEVRCNIGLGTSIFGWSAFHSRWGTSMMKVLEEGEKVEAVFDEGDLRNWYPGVVDQVNPDGNSQYSVGLSRWWTSYQQSCRRGRATVHAAEADSRTSPRISSQRKNCRDHWVWCFRGHWRPHAMAWYISPVLRDLWKRLRKLSWDRRWWFLDKSPQNWMDEHAISWACVPSVPLLNWIRRNCGNCMLIHPKVFLCHILKYISKPASDFFKSCHWRHPTLYVPINTHSIMTSGTIHYTIVIRMTSHDKTLQIYTCYILLHYIIVFCVTSLLYSTCGVFMSSCAFDPMCFHEQTAVAEVWVKSTKNGRLSLTMEDGRWRGHLSCVDSRAFQVSHGGFWMILMPRQQMTEHGVPGSRSAEMLQDICNGTDCGCQSWLHVLDD